MARPAQVFVRSLRAKERAWLRSLRRRGGGFASPVTVRQAQVIDMSRRRYSALGGQSGSSNASDWWSPVPLSWGSRLARSVLSCQCPRFDRQD